MSHLILTGVQVPRCRVHQAPVNQAMILQKSETDFGTSPGPLPEIWDKMAHALAQYNMNGGESVQGNVWEIEFF